MNTKATSIVTYIPVLGFILALLIGDKTSEEAKFHINQSIVISVLMIAIWMCSFILGWIPLLGVLLKIIFWLANMALFVLAMIGLIFAAIDQKFEIPVIATIKIIK